MVADWGQKSVSKMARCWDRVSVGKTEGMIEGIKDGIEGEMLGIMIGKALVPTEGDIGGRIEGVRAGWCRVRTGHRAGKLLGAELGTREGKIGSPLLGPEVRAVDGLAFAGGELLGAGMGPYDGHFAGSHPRCGRQKNGR